MSIFFINSRRNPSPPEPTPDLDAALVAASAGKEAVGIACAGSISPDRAEHIRSLCSSLEGPLLALIADGTLANRTDAVAWVRDQSDGFPAVKYLDLLIYNAGGTFAKLKTAAQEEMAP